MANLSLPVWIAIAVVAFLVALVIGYLAGKRFGRRQSAETTRVREQHEQYKNDVREHFEQTSAIMARMVDDYRDIYQHMADGAEKLADMHREKQVTPPPSPEAITRENETHNAEAETRDQAEAGTRDQKARGAKSETPDQAASEPASGADEEPRSAASAPSGKAEGEHPAHESATEGDRETTSAQAAASSARQEDQTERDKQGEARSTEGQATGQAANSEKDRRTEANAS